MRIGFDGKRAMNNNTGLGNYSRLVIGNIGKEHPADTLLVYVPEMRDNPRLAAIKELHNVEFHLPGSVGFRGSLWRTFGITNHLRGDRVDIYHGLSNELPLNIRSGGVPSVVTIHDLIYRRMPECYKPIDRFLYDYKYRKACENSDRIIAVSKRTKDDITELYNIDPDKIDVAYQGCDKQFKKILVKDELAKVREELRLPDKYILQVGTIEKRKNLEVTVRALADIDPEVCLVVVGKDHHGYLKHIKALSRHLKVDHRIIYFHDLPFNLLPALNQMADVILYPSYYEGFGIPVLEGLESMRPVIAAKGSCLEEAGGPDSFYIDPDDACLISQMVNGIVAGDIPIEDRIKAGKQYASQFSSAAMTDAIFHTYEKVLSK